MAGRPKDFLDKARGAFRAGNFAEALENYEYFFDHALDGDTASYYGVRLSYCLDEWTQLAVKFPAALDRLQKKRDDSLELLIQTRDPERFHDFETICKYLKCENLPVEKFLVVHASDPELAKTIFRFIRSDLVRQGLWDVCAVHLTDTAEQYKFYLQRLDEIMKINEKEGWNHDVIKERHVRDVSDLLLILNNTGKYEEVAYLQKSILSDMQSRNLPELAKDILKDARLSD